MRRATALVVPVRFAECPGLSPAILMQFALKICVAAQNHVKFTKTHYFLGSWPFKVIDIDTPKKPFLVLVAQQSSA